MVAVAIRGSRVTTSWPPNVRFECGLLPNDAFGSVLLTGRHTQANMMGLSETGMRTVFQFRAAVQRRQLLAREHEFNKLLNTVIP